MEAVLSLSRAAKKCWGKLDRQDYAWLPLYVHLGDTAETAKLLWDYWVSDHVRDVIASGIRESFPEEEKRELARKILIFLAASHDDGKASPAFQAKAERAGFTLLLSQLREVDLDCKACLKQYPDPKLTHAIISQAILEKAGVSRSYAGIVGGHHGKPIDDDFSISHALNSPSRTGISKSGWDHVQQELVQYALKLSELPRLPQGKLSITAQILLNGLLIMADWIASGENFPLFDLEDYDMAVDCRKRAENAWNELELPERGAFSDVVTDDLLYEKRFQIKTPRPMQKSALEAAEAMEAPGILIIEAPMGEGKTEAALAAAEIMATKFGQNGIYFALPTQATSNGIFKRIEDWIRSLHEDGPHSVYLAHGKSRFNKDYEEIKENQGFKLEANVQQYDEAGNQEELIVHDWTQGRKKGLLSDFAVGTVDQILMCGLKQKHLALRHLGVENKVVVIDECHAYDTYMSSYLMLVLQWLGAARVPVILLSATLPVERRQALMTAYETFWGCPEKKKKEWKQKKEEAEKTPSVIPYPLLSFFAGTEEKQLMPPAAGKNKKIFIQQLTEEQLLPTLQDLLTEGGCVGIIRNTVSEAQETARLLAKIFGENNIRLLHSRFLSSDRAAKEAEVRRLLGPDEKKRPDKLIVVGTQVMEQSLDVDFDVLFTDLCPMDLLLQRIGRLHRHQRMKPRPEKLTQPRCYVLGITSAAEFAAGSEAVYGKYLLMKTMANLPDVITIPQDIPYLVAKVYDRTFAKQTAEKLLPVQQAYVKAQEQFYTLQDQKQGKAKDFQIKEPKNQQRHGLTGWLSAGLTKDPSGKRGEATVRDTDESLEVLVVVRKRDGFFYTVPDMLATPAYGNRRILLPDEALEKAIAGCSVTLPRQFTAPYLIDKTIAALEERMQELDLVQWYDSFWLSGELFLVLDENMQTELVKKQVMYDAHYGLQVLEEEKA